MYDDDQQKKKLTEIDRLSKMDNAWARLPKLTEYGNMAGIFTTLPAWATHGYYPEELGMIPVSSLTEEMPVPTLQGIALDVGRGSDVNFRRLNPGQMLTDAEILISGEFGDAHPPGWINDLFTEGRGLLAIGEDSPDRHKKMGTWLQTWHVGVVPLVNYYDKNGIGPVMPQQ